MSDIYIKRSPVTGRKYDYFSKDVVHILNLSQVDYYMNECGIMPLDIMLSDDRKNPGKKVVLFCFSREETQSAYSSWCDRQQTEDGDKIGTNS